MTNAIKGLMVVALLAPVALLAEQHKTPQKSSKPAAKTTTPKKPVTIPKDAVSLGGQRWRWVDEKGKAWIFTKTPFSIIKQPESEIEQEKAAAASPVSGDRQFSNIVDEGDTVTFVVKTPFGKNEWKKKKADLTDEEKAAWEEWKANQKKPQS